MIVMISLLDSLVDTIAVMHRCGEIDGRAYLFLTGEVLKIKQEYKASDVSAAIALYEAVKAVIHV